MDADNDKPTGFWVDREVLVDVVIYHTKTTITGCRCGWAKLGYSWAEHVADVVAERSTQPERQLGYPGRQADATPEFPYICNICGFPCDGTGRHVGRAAHRASIVPSDMPVPDW